MEGLNLSATENSFVKCKVRLNYQLTAHAFMKLLTDEWTLNPKWRMIINSQMVCAKTLILSNFDGRLNSISLTMIMEEQSK
jgi:hypothetical protein